jgi:xanthine/uracil/vitamin C permease (AzgA family)
MVGGITTFMTMSCIIFVQPAILSVAGVWKTLVAAVPDSLKHAVAVGIGLLIAFVGLQNGAFQTGLLTVVFIFFFLDLFDTMGTLIGVSAPAGFLRDGKLPRANQAMFEDAVGTVGGL